MSITYHFFYYNETHYNKSYLKTALQLLYSAKQDTKTLVFNQKNEGAITINK